MSSTYGSTFESPANPFMTDAPLLRPSRTIRRNVTMSDNLSMSEGPKVDPIPSGPWNPVPRGYKARGLTYQGWRSTAPARELVEFGARA
jgi:hypothetical protein